MGLVRQEEVGKVEFDGGGGVLWLAAMACTRTSIPSARVHGSGREEVVKVDGKAFQLGVVVI